MMKQLLCLFLIVSSVLCLNYENSQEITSDYTIYWTVDSSSIHLKLVAKTSGWVCISRGLCELMFVDWIWNWRANFGLYAWR